MLIDNLMNTPNWREILEEKNILIKEEYPYVLLKYGVEANWSDELVKQCRGVIFKETEKGYTCVCRPFDKFYNVQETNAADIDWTTARVQEKVDGSLCKLWFDDDVWHWSTMGIIDADKAPLESADLTFGYVIRHADNYNDIDYNRLNKDMTYMFELVSPYNRIVLNYPNPYLYHVGTRSKDGEEFDIDIGIEKPKQYSLSSLKACLDAVEKMNIGELNQEGFVVVDDNWERVKIKSPKYVALHHVASSGTKAWTAKNLIDVIDSPVIEEAIIQFPLLKDSVDNYKRAVVDLHSEIQRELDMARAYYEEYGFDRKATAEKIKEFKYKSPGFWALDNDGNAKDYISSLRPNKYYELLDNLVRKYKQEAEEMRFRIREPEYVYLNNVPEDCIIKTKGFDDATSKNNAMIKLYDKDNNYSFFISNENVRKDGNKLNLVFNKDGCTAVCVKDNKINAMNIVVMQNEDLKSIYDSFTLLRYENSVNNLGLNEESKPNLAYDIEK